MDCDMNPIIRTILEGVYDAGSPLSNLRGTPHLVQIIWKYLIGYWKSLIKIGVNERQVKPPANMEPGTRIILPQDVFFLELSGFHNGHMKFPEPNDININMMPFKMCNVFEECYLPANLFQYWKNFIKPLFTSYSAHARLQKGKICFLTIHESLVGHNESQRRPGLHTDNPGTISIINEQLNSNDDKNDKDWSKGRGLSNANFYEHHWGMGVNLRKNEVEGGIYMASTVPESCAVWNSQIQCDESNGNKEIIGKHGDIEFLRPYIGIMKPNCMYWITDRTPHESLPLKEETYRQYFRLVTHQVSLWFEDHSTKNPLGLVPDPKITKTVKGSKFGCPTQLKVVSDYE